MTQEEHIEYGKTHKLVEQARPVWNYENEFAERGREFPVTFVICQKNTKSTIQLALESLFRFYPDVNVVVMDDNSTDDSVLYLQFMELIKPNLKVYWNKGELFGHGNAMDFAICELVKTEYVMMMDSDVIITRNGFLEQMLMAYLSNPKLYGIGTLQISSYKNNGGEPIDIPDIVPYGSPNLCMYHVPTYLTLPPALTDGTPLILNNKGARDKGLEIAYYPTDKYSLHIGGHGWATIPTIWIDDADVKLRPFLTIVIPYYLEMEAIQSDNDFDLVMISKKTTKEVVFTDGSEKKSVDNWLYDVRFNIHGEYVLDLTEGGSRVVKVHEFFVAELKKKVIEEKAPDIVEVYGMKCYRRRYFQKVNCLQ
jgi:glycosyltransferase involved in cell wall biosynthesis